jgi:hypothetical protein
MSGCRGEEVGPWDGFVEDIQGHETDFHRRGHCGGRRGLRLWGLGTGEKEGESAMELDQFGKRRPEGLLNNILQQ